MACQTYLSQHSGIAFCVVFRKVLMKQVILERCWSTSYLVFPGLELNAHSTDQGWSWSNKKPKLGLKIVLRCKEHGDHVQTDSFAVPDNSFLTFLISSISFLWMYIVANNAMEEQWKTEIILGLKLLTFLVTWERDKLGSGTQRHQGWQRAAPGLWSLQSQWLETENKPWRFLGKYLLLRQSQRQPGIMLCYLSRIAGFCTGTNIYSAIFPSIFQVSSSYSIKLSHWNT